MQRNHVTDRLRHRKPVSGSVNFAYDRGYNGRGYSGSAAPATNRSPEYNATRSRPDNPAIRSTSRPGQAATQATALAQNRRASKGRANRVPKALLGLGLAGVLLANAACAGLPAELPEQYAAKIVQPADAATTYRPPEPPAEKIYPELSDIKNRYPSLYQAITGKAWYQDGLDKHEKALADSLGLIAGLFGEDVAGNVVRDSSFRFDNLPGRDIAVVTTYRNGYEYAPDYARTLMEVLTEVEELAGTYPYNELKLDIGTGPAHAYPYSGVIVLREDNYLPELTAADKGVKAYELFQVILPNAPYWFLKGSAHLAGFLATGFQSYPDIEDLEGIGALAADFGFSSLSEASMNLQELSRQNYLAEYAVAEAGGKLVDRLYRTLGRDSMSAAYKELSRTRVEMESRGRVTIIPDEEVEEVLLKHAPPGRRDEVKRLFDRYVWGLR